MTYNSAYTGPQIDAAARRASIIFDDVAGMLADARDYTAHTASDVFWTATEGFRYRVAASDASDHHLTTAGGVKVYVQPSDDGVYNFKAFNPAADGVTDDYAKLALALNAYAVAGTTAARLAGPTIYFPDAYYFIGSTINLKSVVSLLGGNSGLQGRDHPRLIFPADTPGIIINRHNTLDDQTVTSGGHADSSIIKGLVIYSQGGTDATAHGIWLRTRARIEGVRVDGFPGHGFYLAAGSDGNPFLGNCNLFYLENASAYNNGLSGFHVEGTDANAGLGVMCDAVSNGRWGIDDRSFLGCCWIQCHSSANGVQATAPTSLASFGGKTWHANPNATEAQYVATEPGTNKAVWVEAGTSGNVIAWETGLTEGTYKAGGPYRSSNNNARSLFLNCYVEGGHGNVWMSQHSLYLGGIPNETVSSGGWLRSTFGLNIGRGFLSDDTERDSGRRVKAQLGGDPNSTLVLASELDGFPQFRLRHNSTTGDLVWGQGNGDAAIAFQMTGSDTNFNMGRSVPQPYITHFKTLGIGNGTSVRQHTTGTAAPTTGEWARGDTVYNRDPVAGGFAGWICVTAGTPGTWKQFGAIEA